MRRSWVRTVSCVAAAAVFAPVNVAGAAVPTCTSTHWVGAWAASPSDASPGVGPLDFVDASLHLKASINAQTVRAILTPTYGGSHVRVRLSNRFGAAPVTFTHSTVARRSTGAALVAGTTRPLTFGGAPSVTVAPGQDVLSDPAGFTFAAFQTLAVDVYVAGNAGRATEHYTARQTSYVGNGDAAGEESGTSFTTRQTVRPFVTGVDVLAPAGDGAVVAFGDSITDGMQSFLPGVPETPEGLDADGRYPDVLARRLQAAGRRLSVLNAGISGNKVLTDAGAALDVFGPAALKRLDADVLALSGLTTVIWLEGINDLGGSADPQAVVAGLQEGIKRFHAAGLPVLLGTLMPTSGGTGAQISYSLPAMNVAREQVNAWIRSQKDADGVIDFDAVIRDPADPTRLNPKYDGGDHLHLNLAGYKAMGDAVPLDALTDARCPRRALRVRVSTRVVRLRRLTRLRVTVHGADASPVAGARVRLGRLSARTDATGVAALRVRLTRPVAATLVVSAPGFPTRRLTIRARRG